MNADLFSFLTADRRSTIRLFPALLSLIDYILDHQSSSEQEEAILRRKKKEQKAK
jgi:hypothetical protein